MLRSLESRLGVRFRERGGYCNVAMGVVEMLVFSG